MKSFKRTGAVVVCLLLLAADIAACAVKPPSDEVSRSGGTLAAQESETLDERASAKDALPSDLNYDGASVTFLSEDPGYSGGEANKNMYIQGPDELTGEIVEDAVYNRNKSVEERLNAKIEYVVTVSDYNAITNEVRKVVQAGDNVYDLVIGAQFGLCRLAAEGVYLNALSNPYLDFSRPWWWPGYMEEISIGREKRFFLVGDYFIDMLFGARVLFFNKVIYTNYFGDPDDMYNVVIDGGWTLDKMAEFEKSCYADLNGNSTVDADDLFGYVTYLTYSSVDAFVFATDVKLTKRDANGLVEFDMGTERQITLAEKLLDVFYNQGSYIYPAGENTAKFISGQALFLGNAALLSTTELRGMTDDFGMIPYPKLDESQAGYGALIHDTQQLGAIPVTSLNFEMTGAVLEALSSESYRSVIPAYYETALKVKYTRDEVSAQMIDIIHDSIRTDFAFVYYASLNNIGMIYRTLVTAKSSDFMSEYAKLEKSAQKSLDKLITAYTENN